MTNTSMLSALNERYGEDLVSRVQALVSTAKEKGVKIATAESLTAGGIAHLISCIDTENKVLARGNAVYSNAAKMDLLGVKKDTLDTYTAVSDPVAREMAEGALTRADAQISVAVTGLAGPGDDKNAGIDGGTVFIGLSYATPDGGRTYAEELHFDKARSLDIRQTIIGAVTALELALEAHNNQSSTLRSAISPAMQEGVARDPWMQRASTGELGKNYGTELSGKPNDPLLVGEYGEYAMASIDRILKDAVNKNCKIVIRGDKMASEIAHMLTTLNGSSRVIDRAIIEPGRTTTTLQESNTPANAVVFSAYALEKEKVRVGLEQDGQKDTCNISVGDNPTRDVAFQALDTLERAMQAPQRQATR